MYLPDLRVVSIIFRWSQTGPLNLNLFSDHLIMGANLLALCCQLLALVVVANSADSRGWNDRIDWKTLGEAHLFAHESKQAVMVVIHKVRSLSLSPSPFELGCFCSPGAGLAEI